MYCPSCGKSIASESVFCMFCGKSILGKGTSEFETTTKSKEAIELELLLRKLNLPRDTFTTVELASIRAALQQVETNNFQKTHPIMINYTLSKVWHHDFLHASGFRLEDPKWYIAVTEDFLNAVKGIDSKLQDCILKAIRFLADTPEKSGNDIKLLQNELRGLWQYKIESYRLIYYPDHNRKYIFLLSFLAP